MPDTFPALRAVVLDATDARALAEFYRQLLGFVYRSGDEAPPPGQPDPSGQDWLVLRDRSGEARLAIQHVDELPPSTWPEPQVPQQLHLDLTVPDVGELGVQRDRALTLGAAVLLDRSNDPQEPLYVFADPAGHPFCIFVSPDHPA
jgi:catechol 2,3-dioxygenase-like lactoylglutathione lyase family enzyme